LLQAVADHGVIVRQKYSHVLRNVR
jgi:hypothetical protein